MYDYKSDDFYNKKTINVTWIMIWNGSTEKSWWNPDNYNGTRAYVDGKFQSIDWNNDKHLTEYFYNIKNAGIDVIASDLTNGLAWERQTKLIQKLCYDNDMKMCVAINHHGNVEEYDADAKYIWDTYADPDNPYGSAYLYKDGKPLIVNYCWYTDFDIVQNANTPNGSKFSGMWASGEDSKKDKWGWQVEPQFGFIPSKDSMFITSSINYDSPRTGDDLWRKSLAWLDFGFLLARQENPKYLIIGSYDDVHEHNSWLKCDTRNAAVGWQMKNIFGEISTDVYYNRVSEWLQKGEASTFISGGIIKDGVYQIINSDGRTFFAPAENKAELSELNVFVPETPISSYYWFYHLGDNFYRIIKLNSGYSLEAPTFREGTQIRQNYDNESYCQQWKVEAYNDESFLIINRLYKKALKVAPSGKIVIDTPDERNASVKWLLKPVVVMK